MKVGSQASAFRTIGQHPKRIVFSVDYFPDGDRLVSVGSREFLVWSAKGDEPALKELSTGRAAPIHTAACPTGGVVAVSIGTPQLSLWDPESGRVTPLSHALGTVRMAWTGDGRRLFLGSGGLKSVAIIDVATEAAAAVGKTKRLGTFQVAIASDASRAISGDADKLVHVWNPVSGELIGSLVGHTKAITSVAITKDGRWGFSSSRDGKVRVWDLAEMKESAIMDGGKKPIHALALSPDGERIGSGGDDGVLRVWDRSGRDLAQFPVGRAILCAAWCPTRGEIAVGTVDEFVRVCDV